MTTISQIGVIATELTGLTLLEIEQNGESKQITAELAKSFFDGVPDGGTTSQALLKQSNADGDVTWQTLTKSDVGLSNVDNTSDLNKPVSLATQVELNGKLSDVTNGTGTGVTQVTTPVAGTREIARIGAASTDVVVTQGAAGAPNTIGLNGTTLKYWEEVSTAIDASTQRLAWRPKDPNGTFVRANTVQVIAVPRGLTLRDPLESGSTFPTGFTTGLDLQIKGTTGTSAKFANGGYCFGEGNTASTRGVSVGVGNQSNTYGISLGLNNTSGNLNSSSVSVGIGNTSSGSNIGLSAGVAVGINNAGNNGAAFGIGNTAGGNLATAFGCSNTANQDLSTAVGYSNTISYIAGGGQPGAAFGYTLTNSALGSMQVCVPYALGVALTDQGVTGLMRTGRHVSIPFVRAVTGVTDWTNTAWRTVGGSFLIPESVSNAPCKMRFNFMFKLSDDGTGSGSPSVLPRKGVFELEVWEVTTGTPTVGLRNLQGGDVDFLTYFDFQVIYTGGQAKLQYRVVSDPSSGAAATRKGKFDIYGECSLLHFG